MTLGFFGIGQDAGKSNKKDVASESLKMSLINTIINTLIHNSFLSIYNLHGYMNHTNRCYMN